MIIAIVCAADAACAALSTLVADTCLGTIERVVVSTWTGRDALLPTQKVLGLAICAGVVVRLASRTWLLTLATDIVSAVVVAIVAVATVCHTGDAIQVVLCSTHVGTILTGRAIRTLRTGWVTLQTVIGIGISSRILAIRTGCLALRLSIDLVVGSRTG